MSADKLEIGDHVAVEMREGPPLEGNIVAFESGDRVHVSLFSPTTQTCAARGVPRQWVHWLGPPNTGPCCRSVRH